MQAGIELRDRVRRWTTLSFLTPPVVVYYALTEQNGADWIAGVEAARAMWAAYPVTALSVTGIVTYSSTVMAEQDDGIVLRAKTLPHGVRGYIVGKAVSLALLSLTSIVLVVGAAQLSIGGIAPHELWRLVPLMALLVLTIAATTPLGVILGGLARGPMASVPVSIAVLCGGHRADHKRMDRRRAPCRGPGPRHTGRPGGGPQLRAGVDPGPRHTGRPGHLPQAPRSWPVRRGDRSLRGPVP